MTTPQIDKKKLKTAILLGLDSATLRELLKGTKKKLALAGARADNLPVTPSKAAEFAASLPDRAFDVLRHAMQPLLVAPSASAEEIIAACQLFEGSTKQLDANDLRKAYSNLLWYLGSDPIPAAIKQYLSKHSAGEPEPKAPGTAADSGRDGQADLYHPIDAHRLEAFALDPNAKTQIPQREALALLASLIATRCGSTEIAASFGRVAATQYPDVEELLRRVGSERFVSVDTQTLHIVLANTVESTEDLVPEDLRLIARCTKILDNGQRFLDVVGFRSDTEMSLLSQDQAKQLLPDSGDIVAFPAAGIARLPALNELAVFRVQYKDSPGRTKYRVVSVLNAVFEVVDVPLVSTDVDKFHTWVGKEYPGATVTKPLFHFTDDVLIKLPVDVDTFVNYPGECRADVFANVDAFAWTGRKLVVDLLPPASRKLDLTAIDALVRSLLKRHIADKSMPSGLTKMTIQDIATATRTLSVDEITEQQQERVVNAIESVANSKEKMEGIVELLLSAPKVAKSIEERKSEVLAAFVAETGSVQEAIAKLKRERAELETTLKKAQEEGRRRGREIANSVKAAFNAAKATAGASLAQAALFDEILGRSDAPLQHNELPGAEIKRTCRLSAVPGDPTKILSGIGFPRPSARHLSNAILAARKVGYLVALRGVACNFVAVELGRALSTVGVYVAEIDPGLTASNYSREILAEASDCDIVIFRNANCSPADVILTDVIDTAISKAALGKPHALAPHGPLIILTLPPGPLELPLSAAVLGVSMLIDLDALNQDEATMTGADFLEEVSERASKAGLRPHLWLKMLARLVKELDSIESADQAVALALIDKSVVQPFFSAMGEAKDER